jgi:hypothetical protein
MLRKLGSVATWAGIIGTALWFLRTGRHHPPSEEEAIREAYDRAPENRA